MLELAGAAAPAVVQLQCWATARVAAKPLDSNKSSQMPPRGSTPKDGWPRGPPLPALPTNHWLVKYDAWNRLVELRDGTTGTIVLHAFEYDGLGRRISRYVHSTGVTSHYDYNEQWQLLEERKGGSTNPVEQFIWHPYYIDALAARLWDSNGDGDFQDNDELQYVCQDANFNATAVFNDKSQAIERYVYTPYGEVTMVTAIPTADFNGDGTVDTIDYTNWADHQGATSATQAQGDANGDHTVNSADHTLYSQQSGSTATFQATSAIGNTHLYTGRERDPETGLQLNRHRYYASHLGRWTTRDPIGYEGGSRNLYEYVDSTPLSRSDPEGLQYGGFPHILPPDRPHSPEWHRCRNKKNKCPRIPPSKPITSLEGGIVYEDYIGKCVWLKDSGHGYHGTNKCFRGLGACHGSQCCYNEQGKLDDKGPDQGTYDKSPPYDDRGNFSFPGWVGHCFADVLPHHASGDDYDDDCTTQY